jgi:O-antigen/teichoic acid export membrane protein
VKPFYVFGIDLSVQNRLGSEEYGLYFSLYSLSILMNVILDMGINSYNTKNIAQNPKVLQKYLGKIFGIRIALFFLYAAVVFSIGLILDYDWVRFEMLLWLVVNQFFAAGILFLRSNFGGLHLFKLDGLVSVLDRIVLIGIASVLLWSGLFDYSFDIMYFIFAQTISYILTFFFALVVLYAKTKSIKIKFDRKMAVTILRRSMPYALLIILMMIYTRVDSVMIERISGSKEAGYYAQSFRILDAFNMIGYLFVGLLLPMISRLIKNKGDFIELVDLSFRILIPFSIVILGISFFYSDQILSFAYNDIGPNTPKTFFYLMISFVGMCLTFVYGTLLTANGSMKTLNYAALSGLILNIVLNSILIPLKGAEGAAIATVFTQALVALIQILTTHKLFQAERLVKTYMLIVVFAILVGGLFYGMSLVNFSWIGIIFINIALSLILYFTFGILRLKDLKKIISNNGE